MKTIKQTYLELFVSELWADHCSAPTLLRVDGSVGSLTAPAFSVWGTG